MILTGLTPRPLAFCDSFCGGAGSPEISCASGCLDGELCIRIASLSLGSRRRFEGVLWIPEGGVLTIGSGCSGVGGSSGSSWTTVGSTPVFSGDRCKPRLWKGFSISSSSSCPGGGNGLGCGRVGVRRAGWAPRTPPPTLLEGDRDTCEVAEIVRAPVVADWEAEADASAVPSPSERPSSCAVKALSISTSSSGRFGSDAAMSSGRSGAVSLLRERISGLCLARLDRVGEANDGRWGDREVEV